MKIQYDELKMESKEAKIICNKCPYHQRFEVPMYDTLDICSYKYSDFYRLWGECEILEKERRRSITLEEIEIIKVEEES